MPAVRSHQRPGPFPRLDLGGHGFGKTPMEDPDIVVAHSGASVGSVASDPTEARHDAEASASTTDQE